MGLVLGKSVLFLGKSVVSETTGMVSLVIVREPDVMRKL